MENKRSRPIPGLKFEGGFYRNCLSIFSIKYSYTREYLEESFTEAYKKLGIDEDHILATIDTAVDDYNVLSDDEILDRLTTEFTKVRTSFEHNITVPNQEIYYPKAGIVWGSTDSKTGDVCFYVNANFFSLIKDSTNWINIAEAIYDVYTHEATHQHQVDSAAVELISPGIPNSLSNSEKVKYYSNKQEIDAHARQLASQLLRKYPDFQKLESVLTNKKEELLSFDIYKVYLHYFGKMADKFKWCERVWKRFNKRLKDFLQLDGNFLYSKHFKL